MKILIPLLFALFSVSSAVPVFDRDGDQVRAGVRYLLDRLPAEIGGTVTQEDSVTVCPRSVIVGPRVNRPDPASLLPMTFHPADASDPVVRESTALNIEFVNVPQCIRFWEVHPGDRGVEFVTTGDVVGIVPVPPPTPKFKFVPIGMRNDARVYHLAYGDYPVDLDSSNRLFVSTERRFGSTTPVFQLRKDPSPDQSTQVN